jgi:hypothetical protein
MQKPPEQKNFTEPRHVRVILMIYIILSLFIIPLGFALIAYTIPSQLRALCAAIDPHEKMYRLLNAGGCALIAYGIVVSSLLMLDDFRGAPWKLLEWWPSISRIWHETDNRIVIVLLDLLTVLAAGLGLLCVARCFGYVDEYGTWCEPGWLIRNYRINEALIDFDRVLKRDPLLDPLFATLPESTQIRKMNEWKIELEKYEQRLHDVQRS